MQRDELRVYNQTPREAIVLVRGKKITFPAFTEQVMAKELADLFMRKHPGIIVEAEKAIGGVRTIEQRPEVQYVANMTGDPDGPAEIQMKVWRSKAWHKDMVANPCLKPLMLKEYAAGPMKEYTDKYGELGARQLPGKWISAPPFQRVEMRAGVAHWFLNRCHGSTPRSVDGTVVRKAIQARAPQAFEPDSSWEYDELLAWLAYVDGAAILEPPTAKLRELVLRDQKAEKQKSLEIEGKEPREIKVALKKVKVNEAELGRRVEEAKFLTLKRIYFRLVDPKIAIPTRAEFAEYLHGRDIEKPYDDNPLAAFADAEKQLAEARTND